MFLTYWRHGRISGRNNYKSESIEVHERRKEESFQETESKVREKMFLEFPNLLLYSNTTELGYWTQL